MMTWLRSTPISRHLLNRIDTEGAPIGHLRIGGQAVAVRDLPPFTVRLCLNWRFSVIVLAYVPLLFALYKTFCQNIRDTPKMAAPRNCSASARIFTRPAVSSFSLARETCLYNLKLGLHLAAIMTDNPQQKQPFAPNSYRYFI
ncbi:MAG: hypothetical protein WAS33_09660 [Candidatus Promineifilaceae bacterium]